MQGQNSKQMRKSQQQVPKPLSIKDLHPLLVCDIEPDVRPFVWPRRKRRARSVELDLSLFDTDLIQFFRDLDELE